MNKLIWVPGSIQILFNTFIGLNNYRESIKYSMNCGGVFRFLTLCKKWISKLFNLSYRLWKQPCFVFGKYISDLIQPNRTINKTFKQKLQTLQQIETKQQQSMFPQFIFLSSLASEYDQKLGQLINDSRFEHNLNRLHNKQILELNMDENFIDSPLAASSLGQIEKLRQQIFKYEKYDTVVVAPLQKSLNTCYQIFNSHSQKTTQTNKNNQQKDINFYIEPLLGDRLNSTHAIGDISESRNKNQYTKFNSFYQQFGQKIRKSQWLFDLLPQRIVKELPINSGLTSSAQYVKLLKSTSKRQNPHEQYCLETQIQFSKRIQKLKDSLLEYQHMSGSGKKVLVIASAQVLNHLAATDFHENGQPVNPLRLNHGQHDLVSSVINGLDTVKQLESESILPFCR